MGIVYHVVSSLPEGSASGGENIPVGASEAAMRGSATRSGPVGQNMAGGTETEDRGGGYSGKVHLTLRARTRRWASPPIGRSRYRAASPFIDRIDRLAMEGTDAMNSLPEQVPEYAEAEPEATPIPADDRMHLGDRTSRRGRSAPNARSGRATGPPLTEHANLPHPQAMLRPSLATACSQPVALPGAAFPTRIHGMSPMRLDSKLSETLPHARTDLRR